MVQIRNTLLVVACVVLVLVRVGGLLAAKTGTKRLCRGVRGGSAAASGKAGDFRRGACSKIRGGEGGERGRERRRGGKKRVSRGPKERQPHTHRERERQTC